jgi:hypothetical protein
MSTTGPVLADESSVILLATAQLGRGQQRSRRIAMAIAVLALCLLALIGSFADSAVTRTSLLLVDPPYPGSVDNVAATVIWAMIANLAVCVGVVMLIYWLLSWPSAQIIDLRSERPSPKP